MKKRILKIIALISLAAILTLSFAACGGKSTPGDTTGGWEGLSWAYQKSSKTLTITGSGTMPDAKAPSSVGWLAVAPYVEKVEFKAKDGAAITTVGSYAFYGMSALKSISLPAEITTLGDYSFAFCTSLESITLPAALTSIGKSAFEACISLKTLNISKAVNSIGARAFAFCRELTDISMASAPASFGEWTFKDCKKLTSLTLPVGEYTFADNAFEGAAINKSAIKFNENVSDSTVVTFYCEYDDGTERETLESVTLAFGDSYTKAAKVKDGYTIDGKSSYTVTANGEKTIDIVFKYKKDVAPAPTDPSATEKPTEPTAKDESSMGSKITAIVVMVVVLIAIAVGAIMVVRSGKKQQKGSTVRKNDSTKGKK